MKKNEAIELSESAFEGTFTEEGYSTFIGNLFKKYTSRNKIIEGTYIREAFRPFIFSYKIIGEYKDSVGQKIDIIIVRLQKETSLDRARTAQRNFIADYLKNNEKQAALVAFLAPEGNDWRFSLVKLEYSLAINEGKIKTIDEITPAKRWSFLIGDYEGNHTVKSRFLNIIKN